MILDLHLRVDGLDVDGIWSLLERLAGLGLDGACLTSDGDLTTLWEAARESRLGRFKVLVGAEVGTSNGTILAYFREMEPYVLEGGWKPRFSGLPPARAVINAVHRIGGCVSAASPYHRAGLGPPMFDNVLDLLGLDAVEVRNGSVSNLANEFAFEAAAALGLPGTGGSGSADGLGKAATLVLGEVRNQGDLVEAILAGEVWPIEVGPGPAAGPADERRRAGDAKGDRDRRSVRRRSRQGRRRAG